MEAPKHEVTVKTTEVVKVTEVEVATKADIAILTAKLSSLKAWGIAALVGGQVIAGLIAGIVAPRQVAEQTESLARAIGLI